MIAFFFQAQAAARTKVYHALSSSKQPERRHQERPPRASPGPRAGLGCDVRHVGAARSRRFRVRPPVGRRRRRRTAVFSALLDARRPAHGAAMLNIEGSSFLYLRRGWYFALAAWRPLLAASVNARTSAHAHHMRQAAGISPSMLIARLMFSSASPTSTPSYLQLKFLPSTCIPRLRKHRSTQRAACIARSCSRA